MHVHGRKKWSSFVAKDYDQERMIILSCYDIIAMKLFTVVFC